MNNAEAMQVLKLIVKMITDDACLEEVQNMIVKQRIELATPKKRKYAKKEKTNEIS